MQTTATQHLGHASTLPTPELIDYLVRNFHDPLRATLPDLQLLAVHAAHDRLHPLPALERAADGATDLVDAALTYLDDYDREVFPALARPSAPRLPRLLARVRERAFDLLRLVLRVQRAVACVRGSTLATPTQRELVGAVDALASRLYAQVAFEADTLFGRLA